MLSLPARELRLIEKAGVVERPANLIALWWYRADDQRPLMARDGIGLEHH